MAEVNTKAEHKHLTIRHRGRFEQIGIYFLKFLRMLVYQNDWKVLPMTALIAGLVGFVMGRNYMVTMEGTMTGTFALVCVCIWNGCFNSIQVICRERDVIKREHRSGMHISSYVLAHMMYQLLLCLLQTIITIYVVRLVGLKFPTEGFFTKWFILDFGITVFLITYAADMMSLFISSIAHTTTTAMTIMPFVLVFQLIFSGGVISIPKKAEPLAKLTVSNPGFNAMASQADINSLPYATLSRMVIKMKDTEIEATVTLGQLLDALNEEDSTDVQTDPSSSDKKKDIVNSLATDEEFQEYRDLKIPIHTTLGEIIDLVGEDEIKAFIDESATKANYKPKYEHTKVNIMGNWLHLMLFILIFSALTVISLESIDKDKR